MIITFSRWMSIRSDDKWIKIIGQRQNFVTLCQMINMNSGSNMHLWHPQSHCFWCIKYWQLPYFNIQTQVTLNSNWNLKFWCCQSCVYKVILVLKTIKLHRLLIGVWLYYNLSPPTSYLTTNFSFALNKPENYNFLKQDFWNFVLVPEEN